MTFETKGYEFMPQFFAPEEMQAYGNFVLREFPLHLVKVQDPDRGDVCMVWKPWGAEDFHREASVRIQEKIGLNLIPTYNYLTTYYTGSYMRMHKDRPSCEISMSVNLLSDVDWPLFMEGEPINTKPGDAVLYRGIDVLHWRDPAPQMVRHMQMFFHWIVDGGEHMEHAYDILHGMMTDRNDRLI